MARKKKDNEAVNTAAAETVVDKEVVTEVIEEKNSDIEAEEVAKVEGNTDEIGEEDGLNEEANTTTVDDAKEDVETTVEDTKEESNAESEPVKEETKVVEEKPKRSLYSFNSGGWVFPY